MLRGVEVRNFFFGKECRGKISQIMVQCSHCSDRKEESEEKKKCDNMLKNVKKQNKRNVGKGQNLEKKQKCLCVRTWVVCV